MDQEHTSSWPFQPPHGLEKIPYTSSSLPVSNPLTFSASKPDSSSNETELWLFRVPMHFKIDDLESVNISETITTEPIQSKSSKDHSTYNMIQLLPNTNPETHMKLVDVGEMATMSILHPSDVHQGMRVGKRAFDRIVQIVPSHRVDPVLQEDTLINQGLKALDVPYTPRTPKTGLELQSLPFGFHSGERLVKISKKRSAHSSSSVSETATLPIKIKSKGATPSKNNPKVKKSKKTE
ncbi:hypothetical protein QVD99_007902 [Batrachochytrium dendrobatidis]|nr:hypothetical protein O5D80_001559 [Batrachochytrium dendrobatidis]KAK5665556.1 hypothetical protein QVD99_007902 [Batrachochytrium dendrobatidis]